MSYLSVARAAIIAKGAAVVGIRETHARLPETIGVTPALVLGQMTWVTIPGNRERNTYTFELTLYVERTADDDRAIAIADDLIALLQDAYVTGITLGQPGNTQQCVIRGGSANDWVTIGTATYLAPSFIVELSATQTRTYTA